MYVMCDVTACLPAIGGLYSPHTIQFESVLSNTKHRTHCPTAHSPHRALKVVSQVTSRDAHIIIVNGVSAHDFSCFHILR